MTPCYFVLFMAEWQAAYLGRRRHRYIQPKLSCFSNVLVFHVSLADVGAGGLRHIDRSQYSVGHGHVDGDAIMFSSGGCFGRGMEQILLRSRNTRWYIPNKSRARMLISALPFPMTGVCMRNSVPKITGTRKYPKWSCSLGIGTCKWEFQCLSLHVRYRQQSRVNPCV